MKKYIFSLLALFSFFIIGCGGGGSSENSDSYVKVSNSDEFFQNILNNSECSFFFSKIDDQHILKNNFDPNSLFALVKNGDYLLKEENKTAYMGNDELLNSYLYSYDNDKNLIDKTLITKLNGITQNTQKEVYSYYADGKLKTVMIDMNNDGIYERTITYYYDNNGYLTKSKDETTIFGTTFTYETYYTYDNNYNLIESKTTNLSTGDISDHFFFTYDSNNNLIDWKTDKDGDGVIDEETKYYYDNKLLVKIESKFYDGSSDDATYYYEYYKNANGEYKIVIKEDIFNDDVTDSNTTLYFNNESCLTKMEDKDLNSGDITTMEVKYDSNNNREEILIYENGKLLEEDKFTWIKL